MLIITAGPLFILIYDTPVIGVALDDVERRRLWTGTVVAGLETDADVRVLA